MLLTLRDKLINIDQADRLQKAWFTDISFHRIKTSQKFVDENKNTNDYSIRWWECHWTTCHKDTIFLHMYDIAELMTMLKALNWKEDLYWYLDLEDAKELLVSLLIKYSNNDMFK